MDINSAFKGLNTIFKHTINTQTKKGNSKIFISINYANTVPLKFANMPCTNSPKNLGANSVFWAPEGRQEGGVILKNHTY